jgi:hypothetical protein
MKFCFFLTFLNVALTNATKWGGGGGSCLKEMSSEEISLVKLPLPIPFRSLPLCNPQNEMGLLRLRRSPGPFPPPTPPPTSAVDPHDFDPNAAPDSTYHLHHLIRIRILIYFDADPDANQTFYLDVDPDPDPDPIFQIEAQKLLK